MPRESNQGVGGGQSLASATVAGHPTGVLVCSDILYPEASRILALQGAELLLNPVMSPYNAVDPTRTAREALYVARAYDAGAFVVKAGGFRRPDDDVDFATGAPRPSDGQSFPGIVGRSLIAAPWGIVAHYREEFAPEVLVADLDFARLAEFRRGQAKFPPRRPEAYRPLVEPRA